MLRKIAILTLLPGFSFLLPFLPFLFCPPPPSRTDGSPSNLDHHITSIPSSTKGRAPTRAGKCRLIHQGRTRRMRGAVQLREVWRRRDRRKHHHQVVEKVGKVGKGRGDDDLKMLDSTLGARTRVCLAFDQPTRWRGNLNQNTI